MNNGQQGRRQRQRPSCDRQDCQSLRFRLGGMCAHAAITARRCEALEARNRILEVRAGGQGQMGSATRIEPGHGDPNQLHEMKHTLSERLKALGVLVNEAIETHDNQSMIEPMAALHARLTQELQQTDGADFHMELFQQVSTLDKILRKARHDVQPYVCGICYEPLVPDAMMLGKNCWHYFCLPCISTMALTKVKPGIEVHDNPYWKLTGYIAAANPLEDSDEIKYELRDGVEGTFPEKVWVSCAMCRNQNYSDKALFDFTKSVLGNPPPDNENKVDAEAGVGPREQLNALRNADKVFLLEAPGDDSKVMLIPAKVPRSAVDPRIDDCRKFGQLCMDNGFRYGAVGNDDGKANFRERMFDDEVDTLFAGATLRKTGRTSRWGWEDSTDVHGDAIKIRVKKDRPGGTYKIDLPKPEEPDADWQSDRSYPYDDDDDVSSPGVTPGVSDAGSE